MLFGLIVEALNDHICGLEPALLRALDDDALSSPQSSRPFPGRRPKDGGGPDWVLTSGVADWVATG